MQLLTTRFEAFKDILSTGSMLCGSTKQGQTCNCGYRNLKVDKAKSKSSSIFSTSTVTKNQNYFDDVEHQHKIEQKHNPVFVRMQLILYSPKNFSFFYIFHLFGFHCLLKFF